MTITESLAGIIERKVFEKLPKTVVAKVDGEERMIPIGGGRDPVFVDLDKAGTVKATIVHNLGTGETKTVIDRTINFPPQSRIGKIFQMDRSITLSEELPGVDIKRIKQTIMRGNL